MWDDATRNTVKTVIGIENAAMKITFTPTRQTYDAAEGSATCRAYRRQSRKIAAPSFISAHRWISRGFIRRQRIVPSTIAPTTRRPVTNGCVVKNHPVSSEGEPFDTVRGRKMATPTTMRTLIAVKKAAWTTVATVIPATDEPRMLLR